MSNNVKATLSHDIMTYDISWLPYFSYLSGCWKTRNAQEWNGTGIVVQYNTDADTGHVARNLR